jgi:hypothetical protein
MRNPVLVLRVAKGAAEGASEGAAYIGIQGMGIPTGQKSTGGCEDAFVVDPADPLEGHRFLNRKVFHAGLLAIVLRKLEIYLHLRCIIFSMEKFFNIIYILESMAQTGGGYEPL